MLVLPSLSQIAMLADLTTAAGWADGWEVRLYTNDLVPSGRTLIDDLVEATFTDYAGVGPIVWGSPYIDDDGLAAVDSQLCQWIAGVIADDGEVVYGAYLVDPGTPDVLKGVERFPAPIAFQNQYDSCALAVQLKPGAGSGVMLLQP